MARLRGAPGEWVARSRGGRCLTGLEIGPRDQVLDQRSRDSALFGYLATGRPEARGAARSAATFGMGRFGRWIAEPPAEVGDGPVGPVGRLLKSPQWVVGSFGPGLPFRFSFLVSWRVQVTYRYSRRPFIGPAHGRIGAKNTMANITSQKKRIQRTERERIENRRFTSAIKTLFRRLEKAAEEGDASAIETEHRALVSKIDKAVSKGALHRNNGARKKSRAARIAASAGS